METWFVSTTNFGSSHVGEQPALRFMGGAALLAVPLADRFHMGTQPSGRRCPNVRSHALASKHCTSQHVQVFGGFGEMDFKK